MIKLSKKHIGKFLKVRNPESNKGDFGHALIVAGIERKIGAAVISSKACLRAGVGLLTVNIPKEERMILQVSLPEAMLQFRENNSIDLTPFSAVAIGPGFGLKEDSIELFNEIIMQIMVPFVIDADALTILSLNKSLLNQLPIDTILTPHPKEFDRIFGIHSSIESRIQTAILKANELKCVIVLKGHETLITNGNDSYLNTTGNVGLAKGGSGDALTGMITAFLAQKYEPFIAAQIGVFIHGLAADCTLKSQSVESMLISDVIDNIGIAFKEFN